MAKQAKLRKKNWTRPADMSDEHYELCMSGKMCGAPKKHPTKESSYCRLSPVPGQSGGYPHKCKYHGGAASGKVGNTNAMTHGIYAKALLPGEEEIYDKMSIGNFDHEIKMQRVRLRRALIAERDQAALLNDPDSEVRSKAFRISKTVAKAENGTGIETQIERTVPDYAKIVDSVMSRLIHLENQRHVMNGGQTMTAEEQATKARELLKAMRNSIDVTGAGNES